MTAAHRGDPDRVMAAAGLQPRDLAVSDAHIPLASYCALFEGAAAETRLQDFGMRFGSENPVAVLGALGRLALAAPTLRAALGAICRYFPAHQEHSAISLRHRDGLAVLSYQIRDGRIVARRQDAELSICALLGLMRIALGPSWSPDEVLLEHPRSADPAGHADALRAPVEFTATSNAIVFRAAALRTPMPGADPASVPLLEAVLSRHAEDAPLEDIVGVVQQEVRDGLALGTAALPTVARRLGMAPATLHRRLRERDVTFSAIVRGLRMALALEHVAHAHIPLTETASLLGYSELSAFSRAFSAWTGVSPGEWRRSR